MTAAPAPDKQMALDLFECGMSTGGYDQLRQKYPTLPLYKSIFSQIKAAGMRTMKDVARDIDRAMVAGGATDKLI